MPNGSPLATPLPWNLVAPAYELEVMPEFEHYAREALKLAAPPPGSLVIDVACGPGTLALLAARQGLRAEAIDFAPAMIDRLDARVRRLGLTGVATRTGDGQALPYETGTFAAGFSLFGLMFFPDRAKGFAELRRVLAPGARAVVSSWPAPVPAMAAMFSALREAMARASGQPPPDPVAPPLATEEACRAEMSASFSDVAVHRVSHTGTYESAAHLWQSFERSMALVALMRKSLGEERFRPVADAAREALTGVLGSGRAELEMPALLTLGTAR